MIKNDVILEINYDKEKLNDFINKNDKVIRLAIKHDDINVAFKIIKKIYKTDLNKTKSAIIDLEYKENAYLLEMNQEIWSLFKHQVDFIFSIKNNKLLDSKFKVVLFLGMKC